MTPVPAVNAADRDTGPGRTFSMDAWDGFAANRGRLFDAIKRYEVDNLLVLTGDIHRHVAAELKANFDDPASATIGTELIVGSPLRPSIVEVPLPRGVLVRGQNVLALATTEGSWHAYDAVGVFEPRRG